MSDGFFSTETKQTRTIIPLLPECGECGLFRKCQSPKMPVDGEGRRKILILGEAPGSNEDLQGKPFVGDSGKLVAESLNKFSINFRRDCWIYNSVICRPTTAAGKNRTPTDKEISHCRPNVIRTVQELKPEIIVPLGASAVKSLMRWLWREKVGLISRWDGWQIPCQKLNAWICPTWHPAYILRSDYGVSQRQNDVRRLLFEQHLEAVSKLEGRPWKKVPDWRSNVQVELDVGKAAEFVRSMIGKAPVAFDYEAEGLKPDRKDLEIVCCSVSDGRTTIAYPWHGKTIKATRELLLSDTPLIASNLKYEQRWSMAKLGLRIKNWFLDTMIAAHVLDSRPHVCGIKFLAFALLGQDVWDEEVKPYFESNGSNERNRVREVDVTKLLKYCGLDSLMEWKVAKIQAKQLGIHWPSL